MTKEFPFVEIPNHLKEVVGNPDEGTKIYRRFGTEEDIEEWFNAVCEICHGDGSVSPGGVSMYAKVSRPAVHKRLKEGRLTGFMFHKIKNGKFLKSRKKLDEGGHPYICIPVSECKAWAEKMKKRRGETIEPERKLKSNEQFNKPPKNWRSKIEQKGDDK